MYRNLFDSHTHSKHSLDAVHPVPLLAEAAVKRGLRGFAVTDHCECDCLSGARLDKSHRDALAAAEAYRDTLTITSGIELGQPHLDYPGACRVLDDRPYDFVLLALHRLRGWEEELYEIDYAGYTGADFRRMMEQYFDELLELVEWGRFDALAHLSLPLRYPQYRNGIDLDLARYREAIDPVLRRLAGSGKALELNTSGLRGALGDTLPPLWVLRRFREVGGELVTVGSDAHRAADVGAGLPEALAMLEEAGFSHCAFYRGRKPELHPIRSP